MSKCIIELENEILSGIEVMHKDTYMKFTWANGCLSSIMHSLVFNNFDKDSVLVIHGTCGNSLSFVKFASIICSDFDVHLLDLPGFGRSNFDNNIDINLLENEDIINMYCEVIKTYISSNKLRNVIVLGHSFGGFIASKFVIRHPDMIKKLILVSSAGIYPTLGDHGAYWALLFKLSLPQSILRILNVFDTMITNMINNSFLKYYYKLLSSPHGFADKFVGRFIKLESIFTLTSYWNHPTLYELLSSPIPLGFIHGEHDNIMPCHQSIMFSKLSSCPIHIVSNAYHAPHYENPIEFSIAFRNVVSRVSIPINKNTSGKISLSSYKSSYSPAKTQYTIRKLYIALLQ